MELILGYGAGLLTLINPCVLPILPIVLAGALQADRRAPVALALGMSLSFVLLGVTVAAFGRSIGLTPESLAQGAAVLMIGFGLILLVPQFSARFASATAGLSNSADARMAGLDQSSLTGQFAGGALLGAVWSPCVGPTLGAAIGLASQGQSLIWAGAIMAAFAMGVSTVILALSYGARSALQRRQAAMRVLAARARPILGAVFVAVGLGLFFNLHHVIEAAALDLLPLWLQDLSVAL